MDDEDDDVDDELDELEPRGDDVDDLRGDDDRGSSAWPCVDWVLLVLALAMLALFILVAPRAALAIGVGLACVSVGAVAWVSAQSSEGLSRRLSLLVCGLSCAAFLVWSFKFVFYMPPVRLTSGCGGAFYEHMDHDASEHAPRDEL